MLHEVLTTELLLNIWETAQANLGFEILQTERRSIPSQPAFVINTRGCKTRLEPDAWFLYHQERKGMICCFCELDTGTMTKDQLKAKFWRYDAWATSNQGQEFLIDLYSRHGALTPKATFRIVVVACDRQQKNDRQRLSTIFEAAQLFPRIAGRLHAFTPNNFLPLKNFNESESTAVHRDTKPKH